MHDDQICVDVGTVQRLIIDQFPQWAALPVRAITTAGTVNAIFRIGDSLAARLPIRGQDPVTVHGRLQREAAAAADFARASPVPSPEPVAVGVPGRGYPLPWSVQTWLPGRDALADDPAGSHAFAADLADLLCALRAADTHGQRFSGGGRGGHLPDHDDWMTMCFAKSEGLVDVPKLRAMWARLRELPRVDPDVMCHGDLTPPNVLVDSGRLVGVLDTGGFGPADPALDLVSAWHLLDHGPRNVVRHSLRCSDVQWHRGKAWALQQAMGIVWYYAYTNPAMSRWGKRTLDRLISTPDG